MTEDILSQLDDAAVIALTLYGEARGEGPEGRIAVANVIRNRARAGRAYLGHTPREVCLKPDQFSCWIAAGGTANFELLMATAKTLATGGPVGPVLRECRWIAAGLLSDAFVDNTKGATHYLTSALLGSRPPSWAHGQRVLAVIGAHAFLRVA